MAGGVALFLSMALGMQILAKQQDRVTSPGFGLDFIAFYTGGTFVNEGRHRELFDLKAVKQFEHDLGMKHGVDLQDAFGPWWNPPFYAWVFSPLAKLPYPIATGVWICFNIVCAAAACCLLVRMLPNNLPWQVWALIPVGLAISVPFLQSLTHGQNSGTSLLILAATVTAWRSNRGILAGVIAGLMSYKPQHAAILSVALVLSVGWRAIAGLAITGTALLLVTLITLPGSLGDFLRQMPLNVHFVQVDLVYPWERHATFKAFWRLLLQGRATGEFGAAGMTLTALCTAAIALGLIRLSPLWRIFVDPFSAKQDARARDHFIAAVITATPVVMPFYFDYDLTLLAVPAVLTVTRFIDRRIATAGEGNDANGLAVESLPRSSLGTYRSSTVDRLLLVAWPVLYGWMLINADIGEQFRFNLAVPLTAAVATLTILAGIPRRSFVRFASPLFEVDTPIAKAA